MRVRDWKYGLMLLAAGMALSLSTAACGDDDTDGDDTAAGTGGKSGSSGKAGGGAGKGAGTGGSGTVSPAMCESDTKKATQSSFPAACYTCLCKEAEDNTKVEKCNGNDKCWPLIDCAGAMCPDNAVTCILDKCKAFDPAAAPGTVADPVGKLLQGKCASQCLPPTDGGTEDAGN